MSERDRFEKWISSPPFERDLDRYSEDPDISSWPGNYKDIEVMLAWEAWQEAIRMTTENTLTLAITRDTANLLIDALEIAIEATDRPRPEYSDFQTRCSEQVKSLKLTRDLLQESGHE